MADKVHQFKATKGMLLCRCLISMTTSKDFENKTASFDRANHISTTAEVAWFLWPMMPEMAQARAIVLKNHCASHENQASHQNHATKDWA